MDREEWLIKEEGYDGEKTADNGNRFFLGNGYMGVRGTLSEFTKEDLCAVNLAGIYDKVGDGWREPLNAPNFLYTELFAGAPLNVKTAPFEEHSLILDFYSGILRRKTVFLVDNKRFSYTCERFPDMKDPNFFYEWSVVESDREVELSVKTGIDLDVWDINGPHYVRFEENCKEGGLLEVTGFTAEDREFVRVSSSVSVFSPEETALSFENRDKKLLSTATVLLRPGEKLKICKVSHVFTSKDGKEGKDDRPSSSKEAYARAREEHIAWWEEAWDRSKVLIERDKEAMRALNYSLYHLHSIAPRHRKSMSIPARGLSGQTYKGAVFWDTEMFILDFFLFTEPEVARTLIKYRLDTLPGAKKKAADYGYSGAFYAWESQEGGFDACSDYNVTDVFTKRPMRTYFKDKQVHISAAVVYGIRRYLEATGDMSILAEGAFETVTECALFYYSLLLKRAGGDRYEIRDVIGPDEYHERVNNNFYTNMMARMVFLEALELFDRVNLLPADKRTSILEKYDIDALRNTFRQAAEELFIPSPGEDGVIRQFDGYFSLEDVSVETVRSRLLDPKEYWGGAYGVASDTRVIKQADVATALALFHDSYEKSVLNANYDFYEPRTEHGSSLSACMYALLACYCGRADEAYPFFLKSASADIKGGGKQWAGLVYIGGTHPASEGGAYMNVLRGFAGIEIKNGELTATPKLPGNIERLVFKIVFRGKRYKVTVEKGREEAILEPCG
ncbi:MAG: glycoside hydrolase family 65 protein [Lachnospiraceae bacterium]|nr:glycoside hydrolase family 65 protein [Lachnospiraceae bacterium]